MPYCPDCAVEVDEAQAVCPLCGAKTQTEVVIPSSRYPDRDDRPVKDIIVWPAIRSKCFSVLTLALIVPLLICFFMDQSDGRLTWSLYVVASLASLWGYVGLLLYGLRRPMRLFILLLIMTGVLLMSLDLCDRTLEWFITLAGPILMGAAACLLPIVWLIQRCKLHWINGLGWLLISLTCFTLLLDLLIARYLGQAVLPTWSLIVGIGVLPVASFLLYVHHRVGKHVDLVKWFHV